MNVLDDDILGALGNFQSLALNDTLAADAHDTLVAANGQLRLSSLVVLDINHLLVGVAARFANSVLSVIASVASGLHATALLGHSSLTTLEVECLID